MGLFLCIHVYVCMETQKEIKWQNISKWWIYLKDLWVFILLLFSKFEIFFQMQGEKTENKNQKTKNYKTKVGKKRSEVIYK